MEECNMHEHGIQNGTGRTWTRREMLQAAGFGALAWSVPVRLQAGAAGPIPIALQLYSVRGDCSKDFDAALAQVAKMGVAGVEFAGYYNYADKPKELRRRLDELNLKAAGTHIGMAQLSGDELQQTIRFHQTIGCRFLIVPSDRAFTDPEKSKELADTFNKVSEILKPLGMACGYHNHTNEWRKDGDKSFWELFAERTSHDVVLQQDCGWTAAAGEDPVAFIKKYPGRTRTVHFKPTVVGEEQGRKAFIGQDSVDWAAVYRACVSAGGTEWIVLEQERYPDGKTPMECTAISLAGLKKVVGGS
jgi:sugar phosphate isomerase/epimerase